jgi:hypothetical protein
LAGDGAGRVFAFGPSKLRGVEGKTLSSPIVGLGASPSGGYHLVTGQGRVYSFGDAQLFW